MPLAPVYHPLINYDPPFAVIIGTKNRGLDGFMGLIGFRIFVMQI
jgi:hypothetical protein